MQCGGVECLAQSDAHLKAAVDGSNGKVLEAGHTQIGIQLLGNRSWSDVFGMLLHEGMDLPTCGMLQEQLRPVGTVAPEQDQEAKAESDPTGSVTACNGKIPCGEGCDVDAAAGKVGDMVSFGGLLGEAPVIPVSKYSPAQFIRRGGRIPAPLQSLKN